VVLGGPLGLDQGGGDTRRIFVDVAEATEGAERSCRRRALPVMPVQSTTAPPVKLISLAVMVRAQSDAAKAAMLATSS
jgi:hypothetical protein